MKHKVNLPKIFVRKDKAYLSYEIIAHLNLTPGERLSFQSHENKSFLKIHRRTDKSGAKLQVENRNGLVGFFIRMKESLPDACYIFNANVGREDLHGNYLAPLHHAGHQRARQNASLYC